MELACDLINNVVSMNRIPQHYYFVPNIAPASKMFTKLWSNDWSWIRTMNNMGYKAETWRKGRQLLPMVVSNLWTY